MRARIAEVVRSRRRLVVAADEELGRLRRRLESGPGRRLAGLLALLDDRPDNGPAVEQLRLATAELRELAAGLEAALVALTDRCPVPCRLAVDPAAAEAVPPRIAAAVYFVGAEALANVVKHAGAAADTVELTLRDGDLRLAVSDDGVGGADPAGGTGLASLADRVAAVGGRLTVRRAPAIGYGRGGRDTPVRIGHQIE